MKNPHKNKPKTYKVLIEGIPSHIKIDLVNFEIIEYKKRRIVHSFPKDMKLSEFNEMLNEIINRDKK